MVKKSNLFSGNGNRQNVPSEGVVPIPPMEQPGYGEDISIANRKRYREVQLDFAPEIEVSLFERCHTKILGKLKGFYVAKIKIGCHFPLDKEVGDSLSSC